VFAANSPAPDTNTGRFIGPFELNRVTRGDCSQLIDELPNESIDVVVTSPPYWGQRISNGVGNEADPRQFVTSLTGIFRRLLPKMKAHGVLWINLGDAYNTPVNWRLEDRRFSTLGPKGTGLDPTNSAYVKPRLKRRAFLDREEAWLSYGNLLALPYRLVINLCDAGFLFRGEIVWRKRNPMPEGKCRRPHRHHESIYLLARDERHQFRTSPPVPTVWEFSNEKLDDVRHFSRFPLELPTRCIDAFGLSGPDIVVCDPFSGSGTTGVAAISLGCSYVGFEIDAELAAQSNAWLESAGYGQIRLFES
jgi:DNA modification methylase